MNAFFVPRLGSMIYTMNGMATQLHLQADRPGVYHGQSDVQRRWLTGHALPGTRTSTSRLCWLGRKRARPLRPTRHPRVCTPRQTRIGKPQLFGAVQPRLFDAIVSQHVPPRPMLGCSGGDPAISPSRKPAMLGKLDWSAVPLREPIPLAAGAAVFLVIVAVLDGSRAQATGAISGRNGSRASITSGSA
jgi:hypothetical protein